MTHKHLRLLAAATAVAGVLAAAGCHQAPQITAREAVATASATWAASKDGFLIYSALPRCNANPPPCSDAARVVAIGQKLIAANAAIDRARQLVDLLPADKSLALLPADQQAVITEAQEAAQVEP